MLQITEDQRRLHNPLRLVLVVSLVVNLFLVAVIGGHVLHSRPSQDTPRSKTFIGAVLAHAEAALPPEDAAAFGRVMHRNAGLFVGSAANLSTARADIERQIAEEHLDKDATLAALMRWRVQWNNFFEDFTPTLVEALAEVSPEGRRKLLAQHRTEQQGRPGER